MMAFKFDPVVESNSFYYDKVFCKLSKPDYEQLNYCLLNNETIGQMYKSISHILRRLLSETA